MNRWLTLPQRVCYPQILQYSDIKSYIITVLFVALSVGAPWCLHQIHLAGPTFLPIQYFVLLGGVLFGWRSGLIIGIVSPLLSFAISGMPVISILPQTTIEVATYGLVSGILAEQTNMRSFWVLIGSMTAGRLTLLLTLSFSGLFGTIQSPFGTESNPVQAVWSVTKQGWPGILIQVISIPILLAFIEKVTNGNQSKQIDD